MDYIPEYHGKQTKVEDVETEQILDYERYRDVIIAKYNDGYLCISCYLLC